MSHAHALHPVEYLTYNPGFIMLITSEYFVDGINFVNNYKSLAAELLRMMTAYIRRFMANYLLRTITKHRCGHLKKGINTTLANNIQKQWVTGSDFMSLDHPFGSSGFSS